MKKTAYPTLGVVIPCFNAASTITHTLQALEAFKKKVTQLNFYCVLVDDCSEDHTKTLVLPFLNNGVIDVYHANQKNLGVSQSRNIGIDLCKSTDFITFCDADDEMVFEGFDLATHLNDDLILFDHYLEENNKTRRMEYQQFLPQNSLVSQADLIAYIKNYLTQPNKHHLWTSCWGKFFKTQIIIDAKIVFDTNMKVFEDIKFNFEFLLNAKNVSYIHAPIYVHHRPVMGGYQQSASMGGHNTVNESFAFTQALAPISQLGQHLLKYDFDALILHCIGAYSAITLVRSAVKINAMRTFFSVRKHIVQVFSQTQFRLAFKYYDAKLANGNQLLAALIRSELLTLALIYARHLAKKRYLSQPQKA